MESKDTSGTSAEAQAKAEAEAPIAKVRAGLEALKAEIDKAQERIPEKGPITLARWRIIDGSIGELVDKLGEIRTLAKDAKE